MSTSPKTYQVFKRILFFIVFAYNACDYLEAWDREDGRETQEGGDMGTCVYV